jgi:hypothetical protein
MLKLFGFLTKREDIETLAFVEYHENNHVPLICGLAPPPIVYKRNYLVRGDECNRQDDTIDVDVVTELVFPDRATYLARSGSGERAWPASRSKRTSLRFSIGRGPGPMSSRNM